MGNCLVVHDKVIKVKKADGEIIRYKEPMKVHQVLSEFAGHAISDTFPELSHLEGNTNLIGGHLYYLLPLPKSPMEFEEKSLEYSKPEEGASKGSSGIVRIKLVITKQELEEILRKGGISTADMVSWLQKNGGSDKFYDEDHGNCKGWKPVLDTIPEIN